MKKLLIISVLLLISVGCSAQTADRQMINSVVEIPPLPEELVFAGERVPLENFDTRESLMREMLVTIYMHSRTSLTLMNTTRYFPIIEPILAEFGIPEDMKYLCVAESGLDPNVVSTAGAGGLWQIMPTVGKENGLVVDGEVDERYHIEKATRVACTLLKSYYEEFGSWAFAAAAYNLGPNGLRRRVDKQQSTNYYDTFLPEETLRYMFRILSFKLLIENPSDYGYRLAKSDYREPLTNYYEIEVSGKNIDWAALAREHGTSYRMLRQLNHWIREYDCANSAGRTFVVKIPAEGFRTNSK